MLTVRILQSFGEYRPNRTAQLEPELARALARKRMVEIIGEPAGADLPAANATLNITLPVPQFTTGKGEPDGTGTNEGEPKPRRGSRGSKTVHGSGDATVPAAGGEPGEGPSTDR